MSTGSDRLGYGMDKDMMKITDIHFQEISLGQTPANFSPGVFAMIRTLSENVIMPIAGIILTFIAVTLISNTMNISS